MFCLIISIFLKNPLNSHYVKSYLFLLFISNNCICPMLYGTRSPISTAMHSLLLLLPSLPTTVHLPCIIYSSYQGHCSTAPSQKGTSPDKQLLVLSTVTGLHVLPDGQCSASPPFPPDTFLFPSFTSSFLYPTVMYPFSTDFPCGALVKDLKQT